MLLMAVQPVQLFSLTLILLCRVGSTSPNHLGDVGSAEDRSEKG